MAKRMTWLAMAVIIACTLQVNIAAQKGYETFNKALAAEKTDSDLRGAIRLYEQAVREAGKDRQLAARALLRIGDCYRRLGDAQARVAFTRIIEQFADQTDLVDQARQRLIPSDGPSVAAAVERLAAAVDGNVRIYQGHVTGDGRLGGTDWTNGDIVYTDLVTGRINRIVAGGGPGGYPSWGEDPVLSPDRKQVAYQWFEEPQDGTNNTLHQLRVLSFEPGAKPRVLLNDYTRFSNPFPAAWSADGRRLLVGFELPVPAGSSQPAGQGDFQLAWVSVADAAVTPIRRLEWWRTGGTNWFNLVSLSPDGRHIAFSAPPLQNSRDRSIYVVGVDGNNLTEIVTGGINESPVWTDDGRNVVFVSNRSASFGLWSVPVRDGKAAGLIGSVKGNTGRVQLHGFAPGGVLYYSRDASLDEIFLASVGQDGRVTAATESFPAVGPAWSPDGRSLAFKRQREDGAFDLVVRNLASGQESRWSGTRANGAPLGSAAPVWLSPTALRAGADVRVEMTAGELKLAASLPRALPMATPARDGLGVFALSGAALDNARSHVGVFDPVTGEEKRSFPIPNGVLALAVNPSDDTLVVISPGGRMGVVRTDGSNYREIYTSKELMTSAGSIGWSADGRFIFFVLPAQRSARLMRVSPASGSPEPAGLELPTLRGFDISRDGRIAYSTRHTSMEVLSLRSSSLTKK